MKRSTIIKQLKEDKSYLSLLAIFVFLLLFFCSKMSPLYFSNEWSDINIYFNIGKAMMNGQTLYAESFDHKGPLIFVIYGIGYLISNSSFFGMYIIQSLTWIVFCTSIYYTARLVLNKEFSFLTALIIPVLSLNYTYQGGSAEEFILVLSSCSLYFFCKFFMQKENKKHDKHWMLIHGLLMTCVFFIKFNLIILWFFPILGIFISLLVNKEYKNALQNAIYGALGIAIITLPFVLYFAVNGALLDAYDSYIMLNVKYGARTYDIGYTLTTANARLLFFMKGDILGFALCIIGIFYSPFKYAKTIIGKASMLLAGISYLIMIMTPQVFNVYYTLSLYLFSIIGLIHVLSAISKYIEVKHSKSLLYITASIFLLIAIGTKGFFENGILEMLKIDERETEASHFAKIINQEENPTVINLGIGDGNNVFTICNIIPQHKYFISPNLSHGMYPELRDTQINYIENKAADFLILDMHYFNYGYFVNLPAFKEYYELVSTYERKNDHSPMLYRLKKGAKKSDSTAQE